MHDGHRKRVREKYFSNGIDSLADHEVLELLLFYANRRGDTNPTAHRLIEKFGSLSAVFEADREELESVEGVGEVASTLVTLIPQLFRRYEADKVSSVKEILSAEDAKKFVSPHFFGLKEEHVYLVCLDIRHRVRNAMFLGEGALDFANIDVRKIIKTALNINAYSVIIAHNHPGGVAAPSKADVEATRALADALKPAGIRLYDHIIVTDTESFSMASNERLGILFNR